MGKFISGLLLGAVILFAVFCVLPQESIVKTKDWTTQACASVGAFFTPPAVEEQEENEENETDAEIVAS